MNFRKIHYFITVAEERNISRAAKVLNISQPPLSRMIQTLEGELGTPLFNRTTWGVELTPAGEAFLKQAKKLRTLFEYMHNDVRNLGKQQIDNTLHIGLFGTAMLTVVPDIITMLAKTHPEINVVLHHQQREQQIESLRSGKILAAFDRYHADHIDISVITAYKENRFVAINRNNPLSTRESISLLDLENITMIGPDDTEGANFVEAMYRSQGISVKFTHRVTDMVAAVHLVSKNYGCSVVPESMQALKLPDVVYLPLISEAPQTMELHCAYLEHNRSSLLSTLLETIKQYRKENNNI